MLRFCAVVLLLLVAGCVNVAGGAVQRQLPVSAVSSVTRGPARQVSGEFLYVANYGQGSGPGVTVYQPESTELARVLFAKPYYGGAPAAIAFDSKQNAYVGFGPGGEYVVAVFAAGTTTLTREITTGNSLSGMAIDAADTLYVANPADFNAPLGEISVVPSGSDRPSEFITSGVNRPTILLFDAGGNLYSVNSGNNSIAVFGPGAATPKLTIANHLVNPSAIAIDSRGSLYVANRGTWTGSNFVGPSIAVFAAGQTTPDRTIVAGLNAPDAIALDRAGNLYVANNPPFVSAQGSITVYPPGGSRPNQSILTGIDKPTALGFDSSGNLYVANAKALKTGAVRVYAAGAKTPLRTIVTLVDDPVALGFNAQ